MKHLTVACLLLFCHFGAFSQDVWQWLNPQPSGSPNRNVFFTDTQHGFILNDNGDLMRTSDQGGHWEITDHFPNNAVNTPIMNIADSTGVIAFNGALYVSSDNGSTWSLASSGLSGRMVSVSIVSRDTFFITSSYQLIYKTTDRGKTLTTLTSQNSVYSSTFTDSKTGFIGVDQGVLKTTDGGQTWVKKDSIHYFNSIQFLNKDSGFALGGGNDTLLKTYDGGETWQVADIIQASVIHFLNSKTGFIGVYGGILRTDDGGTTWISVTPPEMARYKYTISSFYFFDSNTGFAVGLNGSILKTINGGQSWSYYSPTYQPIAAVSFPTALTGYMADLYTTFKTKDGGQHWDSLALTGTTFTGPHFSSADTGYFLSSNPLREHRTTDGGQTWTSFNPASIDWAYATSQCYTGPHAGFLLGGGQLLKTIDDGVSWSLVWQAQDSSEFMDLIYFTDSLNGFARRGNAQLMKTTDGGITWSLSYTSPRGFSMLWFFDPLNGLLVADRNGGDALVTHDGGISFSAVHFTTNFIGHIHSIGFFNRQIGFLTTESGGDAGQGAFGYIYKTIDGGQTWKLSRDGFRGSIFFTPDSSVLIAGDNDQLIKNKISGGLQIGSLSVNDDNTCGGEIFSVNISAALSSADSISFIYSGADGKTDTIAATPDRVQDDVVNCSASAKGFVPGAVYSVRVRLRNNGVYQTGNPVNFTSTGPPKPTITDSSGYLVSSIDSANHWFRNGTAIPSAFDRVYYPKTSGIYSVQTIMSNCSSAMSDTVNIKLTDSSANNPGQRFHPNPVTNQLVIDNPEGAPLDYVILNIYGKSIITGSSSDNQIYINTLALPSGEYIIRVKDSHTNVTSSSLFVKL